MDTDQLFLRTLDDLERRTVTTDEYEALMSAAYLRKVLLDSSPLMDQVNATHRLKIRFRMNSVTSLERAILEGRPFYWLLGDAIDPESISSPGLSVPIDATRDQFLKRPVLFIRGHLVTVKDLISQLAHIEGAVHSGRPENEREELLRQAERFAFVGNLPAGVRQVQLIGRIVVRGLTPLREAVTG